MKFSIKDFFSKYDQIRRFRTDFTPCSTRTYIAGLEQENTRGVYSDLCICLHLFCQQFYSSENFDFLL